MSAREKLAWLCFALTAAALAAIAIKQNSVGKTSALAPEPVAVTRHPDQLARIEQRLDRLEDMIRASRQDPGAAGRETAGTDPTAAAAPKPDAASVAAMEQSRRAATAIVERAIQAGSWTVQDAESWRTASIGMSGEDFFELNRRLAEAINSDRLKIEPGAELR